jgi:putative NADPH-quinone reductase
LDSAGGPIQRFITSSWFHSKNTAEVAKFIHEHRPKDVIAQWEKVKNDQDLAFIAPTFWLHFPAILKGWFEHVFSFGDAYYLTLLIGAGEPKVEYRCFTMKKPWYQHNAF